MSRRGAETLGILGNTMTSVKISSCGCSTHKHQSYSRLWIKAWIVSSNTCRFLILRYICACYLWRNLPQEVLTHFYISSIVLLWCNNRMERIILPGAKCVGVFIPLTALLRVEWPWGHWVFHNGKEGRRTNPPKGPDSSTANNFQQNSGFFYQRSSHLSQNHTNLVCVKKHQSFTILPMCSAKEKARPQTVGQSVVLGQKQEGRILTSHIKWGLYRNIIFLEVKQLRLNSRWMFSGKECSMVGSKEPKDPSASITRCYGDAATQTHIFKTFQHLNSLNSGAENGLVSSSWRRYGETSWAKTTVFPDEIWGQNKTFQQACERVDGPYESYGGGLKMRPEMWALNHLLLHR